jgi:hypothetical protein
MNPIVVARKECIGVDPPRTIAKHFYWCPGCDMLHGIAIAPDVQSNGASWTFSGTLECPTYAPSQVFTLTEKRCHTFIRGGQIEFLSDCTHALRGQTVPLPPVPDWVVALDDD